MKIYFCQNEYKSYKSYTTYRHYRKKMKGAAAMKAEQHPFKISEHEPYTMPVPDPPVFYCPSFLFSNLSNRCGAPDRDVRERNRTMVDRGSAVIDVDRASPPL